MGGTCTPRVYIYTMGGPLTPPEFTGECFFFSPKTDAKHLGTSHELSKGAVHSVRVVVMTAKDQKDSFPGLFYADVNSHCTVVPLEGLGLRLDTDNMEIKRGVDGVKLLLPEDRLLGDQLEIVLTCFNLRWVYAKGIGSLGWV